MRIGEIKNLDTPDVLLLDFDDYPPSLTGVILAEIQDALSFLRIGWVSIKLESSQSGNGLHGVVLLKDDWSLLHRICLQLILGSDKKREAIGFYRACHLPVTGQTGYENLLFKQKETVVVSTHGTSRKDEHGTSTPRSAESR